MFLILTSLSLLPEQESDSGVLFNVLHCIKAVADDGKLSLFIRCLLLFSIIVSFYL